MSADTLLVVRGQEACEELLQQLQDRLAELQRGPPLEICVIPRQDFHGGNPLLHGVGFLPALRPADGGKPCEGCEAVMAFLWRRLPRRERRRPDPAAAGGAAGAFDLHAYMSRAIRDEGEDRAAGEGVTPEEIRSLASAPRWRPAESPGAAAAAPAASAAQAPPASAPPGRTGRRPPAPAARPPPAGDGDPDDLMMAKYLKNQTGH